MPINFFHPDDEYGFLSNYSNYGIELDREFWPTVEHYYQAQKFDVKNIQQEILKAETPHKAKRITIKMKEYIVPDWDEVKDEVMRKAVIKKFETHEDLRRLLIATGDEQLIEDFKSDFYWGCGWNGAGQNKLGEILMEVRKSLNTNQINISL